ncbi:DUF4159 domain-containing protein [Sagittula sp. SSi028]|uniref:DUF4159 domain-containing protein n=1 Tax=Sagittula sp. SSi028 TaxID=3400636 RepID=UPI003AF6C391
MTLFGLGFSAPWLLLGLLALPLLWIILRAIPPAPVRRLFPGVVLLLGLKDDEQVTDRTPWWLLLLRMLAVAAVTVGLAGPILNPTEDDAAEGRGPLLVVLDGGWASASDWTLRMSTLDGLLAEAGRADRRVALVQLTDPEDIRFSTADVLRTRLSGLSPDPWSASTDAVARVIDTLPDEPFDSYWMSDGLAHEARTDLLEALEDKGRVTVYQSPRNLMVIDPMTVADGNLTAQLRRLSPGPETEVTIEAHGRDPAGNPAVLLRSPVQFDANALTAGTDLSIPSELRARIERFEIAGADSAAAVTLSDDSLRRREVALIAGREDREGLQLLDPLHYLRKALAPTADILETDLATVLPANPDVIALADVARLTGQETADVLDWIDAGGTLLRFAGPRLAASDLSRDAEDPLMPVRLRAGGRTVGGAMSWGAPKALAPFDEDSPFFGLSLPEDVNVTSQVMAQPDPALADRVIAQLADGTPLVTRKTVGQGQIVLFHVTANAEWSTLPLSGLFVQMLERLAVSSAPSQADPGDLTGTTWQPMRVLDGFGRPQDAGVLPGVDGADLLSAPLGPELRPGLYEGAERSIARNVIAAETELTPAVWPDRITITGLSEPQAQPLAGWLLSAALALLAADVLATLALSGRLRGGVTAALALWVAMALPQDVQAQDSDAQAFAATSDVVLAHILTGDSRVDEIAHAGLRGLSDTLFFRTSVEPAEPIGVDLESDELAFYPLLYWPITSDQPTPSAEAYAKLNTYLRSGGLILFDTRDADVAGFGTNTPEGRKLQQLAAPLDIPPLETVPQDHVLTRTFYLLNDFPGRWQGRPVWVEAAPPDAEQIEGMPFRDLNDNVSPVVIGGNDWAAAWAVDAQGNPMVPLGRGFTGERQREIAYRFGVNLVMHVLTGNYKSDQVHVPELLERLGQ